MVMIKRWSAAFLLVSAVSGCAGILGLDSGQDLGDAAAEADPDAAAAHDDGGLVIADAATADGGVYVDASKADSAPPPTCAPGTADCNGNAADGCEAKLNDPMHCGSCPKQCVPPAMCMAEVCCLPEHAACSSNVDCCSGNCGPGTSGCKK